MSGARNWPIDQQRNHTSRRQRNRFIQKLSPISHGRVLPIPVAPNHRRERTSAFRHYEICGHDAAFWTVVSDVIDGCTCTPLHADPLDSKRRFLIVIKVTKEIGTLSEGR